VAAAVIWGAAFVSVMALATYDLQGYEQLQSLADWLAPFNSPVNGAVAAVAAGWAVEQTPVPRAMQAWLLPPLPKFLTPIARQKGQLFGRRDVLAGLDEWLRQNDRTRELRVNGVFGLAGIGKTRVAMEWLLRQRGSGWHVGELREPVPPDWTPRRPTLLYVDYEAAASIFWRSIGPLASSEGFRHPVRVLFDSAADYKLMLAGVPRYQTAVLAPCLPTVRSASNDPKTVVKGDIERSPEQTPRPRRSPLEDLSGAQVLPDLKPHGASDDNAVFIPITRLEPAQSEKLFCALSGQKVAVKERGSFDATIDGRPRAIVKLAAYARRARQQGSRLDLITAYDPGLTLRTDAEDLIRDAIQVFPEGGLDLLLLASLGIHAPFPAHTRAAIAPGAGDRARLAWLFRHHEANTKSYLANFAPRIAAPKTAVAVLVAVLDRLGPDDIGAFADRLIRVSGRNGESALSTGLVELLGEAWLFEAPRLWEPDDVTALLAVLTYLGDGELVAKALDAAKAHPVADQTSRQVENQLLSALQAFAPIITASLSSSQRQFGEVDQILGPSFFATSAELPPAVKQAFWKGWARHQPMNGPELSLLADSEAWRGSERAYDALRILLGYADAPRTRDWLATGLGAGTTPVELDRSCPWTWCSSWAVASPLA